MSRKAASKKSGSRKPAVSSKSATRARPLGVAAFQDLIREKYYKTDAARGTPGTFMWFMEEVGELATALQNIAPGKKPTRAERANLDEEFADVYAWLMTLANINGVDLEGALRNTRFRGWLKV